MRPRYPSWASASRAHGYDVVCVPRGVRVKGRRYCIGTSRYTLRPVTKKILILPPHDLWPAWTGAPPVDAEDRELPYRLLSSRGYPHRRIDTFGRPWNPAAGSAPILHALDSLRALRILLFRRGSAVVVCNFESSALVLLLLRRLLRFRAKVVVIDVGGLGWRLRRLIQDWVVPRADAVLVYSEHQAAIVRATWPGTRRVWPVLAQVDCRFFWQAEDCPAGPVLSIGDDASRDYATLLQAVEGLVHPVVIRTRQALSSTPPANVTVLAEGLPMGGYRDLVASAAIVVLPLHPTSTPGGVSALVQAMGSGKAVVVSASPGIAEYVRDGEDGLVVPPHDPAALRAAILRLLGNDALRQRLGAAARQSAERRFSYQAWARQLEAVLDEVVAADPCPARSP